SGAEMAERVARYPGAVRRTVEYADQLTFSLKKAKPKLPLHKDSGGQDPMVRLRELVFAGAARTDRYGPRDASTEECYRRLERELDVIEKLGFPGYFLIVHDLVEFARKNNILCQGRGSAANSAVCFALGITAVDAI